MNKKNKYVIYSILALFVILFLPIFLDNFIFNNSIQSSLTNGEWSSFLGSYIGGVIGGAGTLLAVVITTNETRRIQRHTQEEIDADREQASKKERKQFSDEIAKIISKYLSDIKIYYHATQEIFKNISRIQYLQNDLKYAMLSSHISDCKNEIEELRMNITHIQENRPVPIENFNLLKIYLSNIDAAQELLIKLKEVYINSEIENTIESDFLYSIDDLINLTTDFCTNYVNRKQS